MNEAYEFLSKGGVLMIPIALCSVIALTLFLERVWALQRQRVVPDQFLRLLLEALREKRWERAQSLCDSNDSTIARVVRVGMRYVGRSRQVVRETLQEAGRREASYLERFVGALGAVASVAPLLGLLGTVTGMIKVFGKVASEFEKGGDLNPGLLANGIWEALITTAAGLTVAIPTFLMFRYLMSRIDRYVVELEAYCAEVIDLISPDEPNHFDEPTQEQATPKKRRKGRSKPKADATPSAEDEGHEAETGDVDDDSERESA